MSKKKKQISRRIRFFNNAGTRFKAVLMLTRFGVHKKHNQTFWKKWICVCVCVTAPDPGVDCQDQTLILPPGCLTMIKIQPIWYTRQKKSLHNTFRIFTFRVPPCCAATLSGKKNCTIAHKQTQRQKCTHTNLPLFFAFSFSQWCHSLSTFIPHTRSHTYTPQKLKTTCFPAHLLPEKAANLCTPPAHASYVYSNLCLAHRQ